MVREGEHHTNNQSNMEPGVRKKMKELWQVYMTERQQEEAMSDMNSSDVSLTQLLMIASEERLGELKSLAEQCLELDLSASQEIAPQARTMWNTEMRNNKSNDNSFAIPINFLLIPPEEEAALEQMSEFRPDVKSASVADNSSEGLDSEASDSSQQYDSAVSSLSQEPLGDACNCQPGNPWNNLPSICASESIGSGDSEHSSAQQNIEKDPASDLDITPDILNDHQDKSMSVSSEIQVETPSPKLSKLASHLIQSGETIFTSTIQTLPSSSDSALPTSQMRLSDCSESLLSLIPLVQDSSSRIHTSPQRKVALKSKVPISPILSQGSENMLNSTFITRNIFSSNSRRYKDTCHREWKAVKRKQAPEDLDTILFDQEQQEPVPKDCAAVVISSANSGIQTENDSNVNIKGKTTNDSCMDIKQTRTEQKNKTGSTKSAVNGGKSPLGKKTLPYKPCLDFVTKQKMKVAESSENVLPVADLPTTSRTTSKDPSSKSHGQSSTFQAPVLEMKKTKTTHCDGTFFQYKYKPPSAELCTRVNAVRMPADLYDWAVEILYKGKETDP